MMSLEQIAKKISEASAAELELVWIPKIMGNQTDDEKKRFDTIENNGIGLNGADAHFVTFIYSRIRHGWHLTDKQVAKMRRILPKYKKQYARMMKGAAEEPEKKKLISFEDPLEGTCWDDDFGEDYD